MKLFLQLSVFLLIAACSKSEVNENRPATAAETTSNLKASPIYYFSTFGSETDQKLYIYSSTNSTSFSLYANTGYSGPTGILRDPSLIYYNNNYYIAFTNAKFTTANTSFCIASSSNLKTWTTIATVNCGVSGTKFTWAPDWFIDGSTVKLIVNIGSGDATMKPYIFTAKNTALTSWSGPEDMNIGTNHIDAFVVKSGSTYHCFCKDETSKYIVRATASSLTGPWSWKNTYWRYYEGPCLIHLNDGKWRIYVDHYSARDGLYTATSSDLNTWSSLTKCGFGRHGSCIIR